MSAKSNADLTTENNSVVVTVTTPESITPATLGALLQDMIDSFYNYEDDDLMRYPVDITKVQLAALIAGNTVIDKQWYRITDRADGFPLHVQGLSTNYIAPAGIWINAGVPLPVVMDYVAGDEGETNPFLAYTDADGSLKVNYPLIISDGSQGADYVLVSDANGKTKWQPIKQSQSALLNPASMTGAVPAMMGLAGSISPMKTGKVLVVISGEYTSDTTAVDTILGLRMGTGAAPGNGDAATGTAMQTNTRIASSAVARIPFSINCVVSIAPGTPAIPIPYWIDLCILNNAASTVQLFGVSISAIEQ